MGYQELVLNLPTDFTEELLRREIGRRLGIAVSEFSYQIVKKSLDARKKSDIHWTVRAGVTSPGITDPPPEAVPDLVIPHQKGRGTVVVAGSGPAGFFAAYALQKSGYEVTVVERGSEVDARSSRIDAFEQTGVFDPLGNYAFGEGGAGTFSDGKLTSRTKNISREKAFVISSYIDAGAPEEIRYLAHPHLGSDNLKSIVKNLAEAFRELGGRILFETTLNDLVVRDGRVSEVTTSRGTLPSDHVIVAPGHSAFDTYRMLMLRGVRFRTKSFAIGSRIEHPQELINQAQWGHASLSGVKAAEYRLASKGDGKSPVYTFCMCPGGTVVPAGATPHVNIVNGMSLYARDGRYANAGCVVGTSVEKLAGREVTPREALEWLEALEQSFFEYADGFRAPACGIRDFIETRAPQGLPTSSYPFGLMPAPLWELLPAKVSHSLREGLKDFSRKIRGFDTGVLMGLESKTSSPIQVLREPYGRCDGFENLSVIGEGAGYSGGIISSAVDGVRCAMSLV
jgi:uncharacterized protein